MITVIIPTLNEEENIASVVNFAKVQPNVSEVIVVDDKSLDKTVSIALDNGAKVITSTKLGKGASMKDGVLGANNQIVAFLDGDIDPYPHYTIKLLTDPILQGEVDFVKSAFNRNAGRVTELVAKPLLSIFFPDLLRFSQPLSGMIAGKKSLFQQLDFRDDYGVDIGILIDMYLMNVRMKEIEIGYLENKSKPWQALGKMSKEVAQTIILKAASSKNPHYNFEELGVLNEIRSQMEFALENQLSTLDKLVVFDMDNTLLIGRFIDICADKFGFKKELMNIRSSETDAIILTKRIATLLKGKTINELIEIADSIPVIEGTKEIIIELKKRGYIVGIISDSYDCITSHIKIKLGLDFSLSNELEFSKSICTGEVKFRHFFSAIKKYLQAFALQNQCIVKHI
ncbi:MAG: glycosyltransferase [Saprospiraceae bacterium]|nr:glycosyltransferase [Candidatus Vicinibacter affinis]